MAAALSGMTAAANQPEKPVPVFSPNAKIIGLFAGGTLALEAATIAARAFGVPHGHGAAGSMLTSERREIIDLGDDQYTRGRPHPMIDGESRNQFIRSLGALAGPTILLYDVELGTGAQMDPTSGLVGALLALKSVNEAAGLPVAFVANLLGTEGMPRA